MSPTKRIAISTDVKESFFDDPFFRDWWNDFDQPAAKSPEVSLQRQVSATTPKKNILDSFFDLKSSRGTGALSTSSQSSGRSSSSFTLKDGVFSLEIGVQNFDPEDIDIMVENNRLVVNGEKEIKRGNSSSKRCFKQSFDLPKGIDVDNISSKINLDGNLVIFAPSLLKEETSTAAQSFSRFLPDGDEHVEVTTEQFTDSSGTVYETTTTTTTTQSSSSGDGKKKVPALIRGSSGESGTITMTTSKKVSSSSTTSEADVPIEISFGGDAKQKIKAPKQRVLPFAFDEEEEITSFSMPSAEDMMAQMQKQMQAQMEQMKMGGKFGTMEPMEMEFTVQSSKSTQKQQKEQQQQQQQQKIQHGQPKNKNEIMQQEFFVPLNQINKVQQGALAEASAMAKFKDGFFEVVINLERFEPEDIKVYLDGHSVIVQAEKKKGGVVCDSYDQTISLPLDVDPDRLTSGMSRDGILMIRVPKKKSPDRCIPIRFDAKVNAMQNAVQKSFQHLMSEGTTLDHGKEDLIKENIVPLSAEKPEDAVKAASAELIESLTVGVAQEAGAEAGEEVGGNEAAAKAQAILEEAITKVATETATEVGSEIAGDVGVSVAVKAAVEPAVKAGLLAASRLGEEIGKEVGRVSGGQAAAVAAAEELAKMNIADMTEEKARGLKTHFMELGAKVGKDTAKTAGAEAGASIAVDEPLQKAKDVAKDLAESAALQVKSMLDEVIDEATLLSADSGEKAGRCAGEESGQQTAVKAALQVAENEAIKCVTVILGEQGIPLAKDVAAKVAKSVAERLGKQLGGEVGAESGREAGIEAGRKAAREEALRDFKFPIDEAKKKAIKEKAAAKAIKAATEAGAAAGREAGFAIEIDVVVSEAVAETLNELEAKASEVKAFQQIGAEMAREAGKLAGKEAGSVAGSAEGIRVAREALMVEINKASAKGALFDPQSSTAKIAKDVAMQLAENLGRELGQKAGAEAGEVAGGDSGEEAGKVEAMKHNILGMKTEDIDKLKATIKMVGQQTGKPSGDKAGKEAASKINIPKIIKDALAAAKAAAEEAKLIEETKEKEEHIKALKSMMLNEAKMAGKAAGSKAAKEASNKVFEEFILPDVIKVCEECGGTKGNEIFGDFGGKIGAEAAVTAGRKVALSKALELLEPVLDEMGGNAGEKNGEERGMEEASKIDWKSVKNDKIAEFRNKFQAFGTQAGSKAGITIFKESCLKIDRTLIIEASKDAALQAAQKYSIKAREFCRMAVKIAEEAGGKAGAQVGKSKGGEAGELEGGNVGEKVGRESGEKSGKEIAGQEGAKLGAAAGAKAGRAFGLNVGKEAGLKAGEQHGRAAGREAGGKAGLEEAKLVFKVGISKERVAVMKKRFSEVGSKVGEESGRTEGVAKAIIAATEEAMKFCYQEGAKAGAAAARKKQAADVKVLGEEGAVIGEEEGAKAGAIAGAEAGERAGGDEAERLGGDEGERIGREIAGEEGAKIGREIGAEVARLAGMKLGKKVGRTAGGVAGREAGKIAGAEAGKEAAMAPTKDKVDALRKLFKEKAEKSAAAAGAGAGAEAAIHAIQQIIIEAAAKAARDKILAMASRGEIKLAATWQPTALISVILNRTDLSDMQKVKLAAKAKMEGNLGDLLPKKYKGKYSMDDAESSAVGKLDFCAQDQSKVEEEVDKTEKWKTVVYSDLPEEKKREKASSAKDSVNSLRRKFETSNMKNNEAYVIM